MCQTDDFTKEYQLVFQTLQNCGKKEDLNIVGEYYMNFKRRWRRLSESNDRSIRKLSIVYDRELNDHFITKTN